MQALVGLVVFSMLMGSGLIGISWLFDVLGFRGGGGGRVQNGFKSGSKVAGFKKSTLKAFAFGGCDSPLCDQLLFLYEWLRVEKPHWLCLFSGG